LSQPLLRLHEVDLAKIGAGCGNCVDRPAAARLPAPVTSPPDADVPVGDRLVRAYFGLHRLEWTVDGCVDFALPYGDWFRLLRGAGFEVEDLLELGAPADATRDWSFVTAEWARRWPSEHVWKAVKRGAGAA
jgi:hypothetical protein